MAKKQALGIHIILKNKVGNFAKILADLSGLSFEDADLCNSTKELPSFHYRRYQNCVFGKKQGKEQYFYFTANITLEKPPARSNESEIGAVVLSVPSLGTSCENSIEDRDEIIKAINKLLFNCGGDSLGKVKISTGGRICLYDIKNREFVNELLTKNCVFQVTTSAETYRAKIFNLYKNMDFYKTIAKKENLKADIERAYIDTTFSYDDNISKDICKDSPLAKLYLCCRYGNKPGALAAAINTLLFRKFDNAQNNTDTVFNITFLIDYFSFSPSVSYNDFYGYLESAEENIRKRGSVSDAREIIERILICPITGDSPWTEYANALWKFLKEKDDYRAMDKKETELSNSTDNLIDSDNYFIYRKEKRPCEITKDSKRHPNEGCDICKKYWRQKTV